MDIFVITLKQVIELFLIMLVGGVCYKTGLVTDKSKKELSNLLVSVVIPAIILNSFQTQMDLSKAKLLIEAFFDCALVHVLLILLSFFLLPERSGQHIRIERLSVIYTNAGFMGIPLLTAIFGAEGTFYAAVYVAVFHLFMWTHGVFTLAKEKSVKTVVKQLCSPTIAAVALSLLLFFLDFKLPELLLTPISYLSGMNTPLAMLATGVSLASYDLLKLFQNRRLYYIAGLRLLILPALLILLFRLFGLTNTAAVCVLAAAACPTGALIPMVAVQYGHDERTASGVFALTTLLSLFTIPLFMLFV